VERAALSWSAPGGTQPRYATGRSQGIVIIQSVKHPKKKIFRGYFNFQVFG